MYEYSYDYPQGWWELKEFVGVLPKDPGRLAIAILNRHLEIYNTKESIDHHVSSKPPTSLFDIVVAQIAQAIGEDPETDSAALSSLPPHILRRVIWKWDRLPYHTWSSLRSKFSTTSEARSHNNSTTQDLPSEYFSSDVDEW